MALALIDFIEQVIAGVKAPIVGQYVTLVSNRDSSVWQATAASNGVGLWTINPAPPPGSYQQFYGASQGLQTTLIDSSYLVPSLGGASGTFTDRSGTITAGGTAQQLAAANASRRCLIFENLSNADLWLNFTTTAVQAQPSIRVASGVLMIFDDYVSTELVSVIGGTTGQPFAAKEGQ